MVIPKAVASAYNTPVALYPHATPSDLNIQISQPDVAPLFEIAAPAYPILMVPVASAHYPDMALQASHLNLLR